MVDIKIDGLTREEARELIWNLERNRRFIVEELKDGRKIYIATTGRKTSRVRIERDGEEIKEKGHDILIEYDGQPTGIHYLDIIEDLLIKREVNEEKTKIIIEAIEDYLKLKSWDEIVEKSPSIKEEDLPGFKIEFLIKIIRWLALQEDINYWGYKPNGEKFEGRNKPINFIRDVFIKGKTVREALFAHQI